MVSMEIQGTEVGRPTRVSDSVLETESVCRRAEKNDPGELGRQQQEQRAGVAVPRKNWTFDDDVSM
jgi:hypothetical protein